MSAKQLHYGQDARERLLRGVDQLAHAVRVPLGPRGRKVMIEKSASVASLLLTTEVLIADTPAAEPGVSI